MTIDRLASICWWQVRSAFSLTFEAPTQVFLVNFWISNKNNWQKYTLKKTKNLNRVSNKHLTNVNDFCMWKSYFFHRYLSSFCTNLKKKIWNQNYYERHLLIYTRVIFKSFKSLKNYFFFIYLLHRNLILIVIYLTKNNS